MINTMHLKQRKKQISYSEISAFCSQMGDILGSGISAMEGLTILIEDSHSNDEKGLLTTIYNELVTTGYLYMGLHATNVFPDYMVNLVKMGEETGSLDNIMKSLTEQYERENSLQTALHNAIVYPAIMLVMMLAVITIIITKVLPIFNQVFSQLGTEMNSVSILLMNIGHVLNKYSLIFLIIIAALIAVLIMFTQSAIGRKAAQKTLSCLPFISGIEHTTSLCRLCDAMKLAIQSGFSSERGLEMAKQLIDNDAFYRKLDTCQQLMQEGINLVPALSQASILTSLQSRMLLIGHKTGSIEEVLARIASESEEELDTRLSGMIAIIEPTLVAILAIITGIILMSVMMPLLGILSGF